MAEARQALTNMGHILKAANCTFNNVVKTTVLMADMKVTLTLTRIIIENIEIAIYFNPRTMLL